MCIFVLSCSVALHGVLKRTIFNTTEHDKTKIHITNSQYKRTNSVRFRGNRRAQQPHPFNQIEMSYSGEITMV